MIGNGHGQSMELFFVDGRADGMLTAGIFNWTGHVLVTPRTQLSAALKRPEARKTGVYLLFGENESGPLAYIGEGEDISSRIRSHDAAKEWWSTAIFVTSAENSLNKAHVKYLEARLIERAHSVGKIALENSANPTRPSMTEAAQANMENFLEYLHIVLPALRIDCFLSEKRPVIFPSSTVAVVGAEVLFELSTPKHGVSATASLVNGEFVVHAGSIARRAWMGQGSEDSSYAKLFKELQRTGMLVEKASNCEFSDNYAFASPSAAAAVINGRPANGTLAWKVKGSNKTYKDWEAEKLNCDQPLDLSLSTAMATEKRPEIIAFELRFPEKELGV